MLDSLINKAEFFDEELVFSNTMQQSHLARALNYREMLYPIVDNFLSPQNQSLKSQQLQQELDHKAPDHNLESRQDLYKIKRIKAEIIGDFVEEILGNPSSYGLEFKSPPSVNDKLWTRTLLEHDFVYYGPVTVLCVGAILEESEELELNPIYSLLRQNVEFRQVTEIRVNNYQDIYYEAINKIFRWQIPFLDDEQLVTIIERMISENNLLNNAAISLNGSCPIADFEHPCGYIRGSAVIPPAAEAPFLTLRIHPGDPYRLDDLVNFGMLDDQIKDFLVAAQTAGTTISIAGTMGSGKTTLLSALSEYWPADKGRKGTIEDTPELRPRIDDLVKMRTIEYEREDVKNIDVTRLTKACKRHSVRYVVLSEARDGSAWEILQLSQAILGSLMTFHYTLRSNRYLVDQALNTLVALCKQHPLAPQGDDIKHLVASMVQILLLVEQSPVDNIRRIIKIYYVTGFDELNGGHFKFIELFSYEPGEGFKFVNCAKEFEEYLSLKGVDYKFADIS